MINFVRLKVQFFHLLATIRKAESFLKMRKSLRLTFVKITGQLFCLNVKKVRQVVVSFCDFSRPIFSSIYTQLTTWVMLNFL